ncbi:hypothetical protein SAMN05444166_6193 [Singulisphaera sp. GP187]|nr:hypothetical protein SAMN05444166_6193 [Singulisphaera sp. GP187]
MVLLMESVETESNVGDQAHGFIIAMAWIEVGC